MERVLRKAVVNHLELNLKLAANQHGSRAGRSTLSQLLLHYDEVLTALESGENMDVIYLDFSKAYDKVDHGILLHKLKKIGISGKVGRWIAAFLMNRRQQVIVKGHKSEASCLKSGVPQGSVIGPLLFLIYIGDIDDEVTAKVLVYVDDSKVKDKIVNKDDVMKLQEELDKIYMWEEANNMKFNPDKFELLRYGKNVDLKETTMYFTSKMEKVIEQVNWTKDLGVILEDTGSFNSQIEKVCKKVRQKCGWILRTFYTRNLSFMRYMWNTYVQPHIDYCSQLWSPHDGGNLQRIEKLLQSFTARIPAIRHLNYWERLKSIRMNSEQRRLERYKIIYAWKIFEQKVPNCGLEWEQSDLTGRQVKLRPLKREARRLREASFQEIGPKLFNNLPKKVRNLKNIEVEDFKEALDEVLSKIPDEPKVEGLTPAAMTDNAEHSNSLLQQMKGTRRRSVGT